MHRVQVQTENHGETEEFSQSVLETPTVSGVLTALPEFPSCHLSMVYSANIHRTTVCRELLKKKDKKMIGT